MRYLIDTNIAIWSVINPEKIIAYNQIILENNEIFISQVSLFEIAIKQKIGKMPELALTTEKLIERFEIDGFKILSINNQHIAHYHNVPLLEEHKDPFDKLIIATALCENMPIISADAKFTFYKDLITLIEN